MSKELSGPSKTGYLYAAGVLTGIVLPLILKSKKFRKAAVCTVAKGMEAKDEASTQIVSIKEDAQDIYAEAKQKRADAAAKKQTAVKPKVQQSSAKAAK